MITEPEMWDESGADRPTDVVSGRDRPPHTIDWAGLSRRRWVWAVGGIVVTCAVWASALTGTGVWGDGRPDLHGYRLRTNPCAGDTFAPLSDALRLPGFAVSSASISQGPAMDRAHCDLTAETPVRGGWMTTYFVNVSVELHRTTDPRAEFDNEMHTRSSSLAGSDGNGDDGSAYSSTITVSSGDSLSPGKVTPVSGLGDSAYFATSGQAAQNLKVLRGGAVISLDVSGVSDWTGSQGANFDNSDRVPDLTRIRPALTSSMRHLMAALSR